MPRFVRVLATFAVIALTSGCAGSENAFTTPGADKARRSATSTALARARDLEQSGDWSGAVESWRIVDALGLERATAQQRIAALESKIQQLAEEHVAAGQQANARGQRTTAKQHWLAALALKPDSAAAQQGLRALESRYGLARLKQTPATAPPVSAATTSPTATQTTSETETTPPAAALTSQTLESGYKSDLAEEAYQRGLAAYRSDKAAAARAFREALEHDPSHAKSQSYLNVLQRLGVE